MRTAAPGSTHHDGDQRHPDEEWEPAHQEGAHQEPQAQRRARLPPQLRAGRRARTLAAAAALAVAGAGGVAGDHEDRPQRLLRDLQVVDGGHAARPARQRLQLDGLHVDPGHGGQGYVTDLTFESSQPQKSVQNSLTLQTHVHVL